MHIASKYDSLHVIQHTFRGILATRIHLVSEQILEDRLGLLQALLYLHSIWPSPPSINGSNKVQQISVIGGLACHVAAIYTFTMARPAACLILSASGCER